METEGKWERKNPSHTFCWSRWWVKQTARSKDASRNVGKRAAWVNKEEVLHGYHKEFLRMIWLSAQEKYRNPHTSVTFPHLQWPAWDTITETLRANSKTLCPSLKKKKTKKPNKLLNTQGKKNLLSYKKGAECSESKSWIMHDVSQTTDNKCQLVMKVRFSILMSP